MLNSYGHLTIFDWPTWVILGIGTVAFLVGMLNSKRGGR